MTNQPPPPYVPQVVTGGFNQHYWEQPAPFFQRMPLMSPDLLAYLDTPALVLQTVVTLGEKTDDGHVIEAVGVYWFEIIKLISKDPRALDQIHWRKMEEITAGAYKAAGFDVILTDRSGDHGRDLIATRKACGLSIRIIDQVKKYAPGNPVSANDVRALLAVLLSDRNATKGIVTTTSTFAPGIVTDPFLAPYIPNRLELRPGVELMKWLEEIAQKRGKNGDRGD